jgi:hypothetical protein
MMRLISAALLVVGAVQPVGAQSLADVARKEEERRKAVKSSGKVYTNDELQPVPQPSAAPAASGDPAGTAAPPPGSDATSSEAASSDKGLAKDDEKAWRKRMTDARDALERSKTFASALQNQFNSLVTDFVNRDDPAQRSAIASQRDKTTAELARIKKEIESQTKAISDIQEEARRAGIPGGWVR